MMSLLEAPGFPEVSPRETSPSLSIRSRKVTPTRDCPFYCRPMTLDVKRQIGDQWPGIINGGTS
jgi:hypothetical protein